jgi:hypothetical protein
MELVATLPPRSHESSGLEDVDVLRDRLSGGTHAVLCGQARAEFEQCLSVSVRELVEDRAACGIGECLENVSHDSDVRQVMTCLSTPETGEEIDMWVRATLSCQRIGGEWQIVHDHESVPFDPATGQAELGLSPPHKPAPPAPPPPHPGSSPFDNPRPSQGRR